MELAQEKNKIPLPLIPEKYGIRLPSDKHCLTGINFSIVPDVRGIFFSELACNGSLIFFYWKAPPPPRPLEKAASSMMDTQDTLVEPENEPISIIAPADIVKRGRDAMEDDDYDF